MDDDSWTVDTREAIISQIEQFFTENPDFHTEILDMSVELDDACSEASVWIRRTDVGLAEGPRRETVMQFLWVRKGLEWFCSGYQGVRSFPFYGGE